MWPSIDEAIITLVQELLILAVDVYEWYIEKYCVIFICIHQMNGCEPPNFGHCSFTLGTPE